MKEFQAFLVFMLIWNVFGRVSSRFHFTRHLIIVSDNTTLVQEGSAFKNAVAVDYFSDVNWVPNGYVIWDKSNSFDVIETITLIKSFNVPGDPISCTIQAWVDNSFEFYVNDEGILTWTAIIDPNSYFSIDICSWIINGDNIFKFVASNYGGWAGLLFILDIKYR